MEYDPEIHFNPPYLSEAENHYLTLFVALENWHVIPWVDPISKKEYPEVKFSMFKLLEYKNRRILKDTRKAKVDQKFSK